MTSRAAPRRSRWRARLGLALVGLAAFAVFALWRVPAGVLTRLAERLDGVALTAVAGTLWGGSAGLAVHGEDLGRFAWRFAPGKLLGGTVGVTWRLRNPDLRLQGDAVAALGGFRLTASGQVGAAALNRVLGEYHIRLGGELAVEDWSLERGWRDSAWTVDAALRWSGGRTNYRLSGQSYDVDFPPLVGSLATTGGEPCLAVSVRPEADAAPILLARLDARGWLHISVTRRFTRLAGNPWPGAGADDEVVVTVAEQILAVAPAPAASAAEGFRGAGLKAGGGPRVGIVGY